MNRDEIISWYHSLTNEEKEQFRIACLEIFQLETLQSDKLEVIRMIPQEEGILISKIATLGNTIIFSSHGF